MDKFDRNENSCRSSGPTVLASGGGFLEKLSMSGERLLRGRRTGQILYCVLHIIIAKGNASFLVTAKGRSRENPPRTLTPWSARARTALRPSANRPGSPYGLAPQFRLGVRGDFRPRGLLFAKHVIFRLVVTAVTPLISPSQTAYLRYQGARTGPKGEKRVPGLRCSAGPGPGFSHYRAFWVLRVTGAP